MLEAPRGLVAHNCINLRLPAHGAFLDYDYRVEQRVITTAELLSNALDPENLSVVDLEVSSGCLVDNLDGTWTYTPVADDNGEVSFVYGISDGTVRIDTSASLTITPVNDAPTGTVTIDDTTPTTTFSITASNDIHDADGVGSISYQWEAMLMGTALMRASPPKPPLRWATSLPALRRPWVAGSGPAMTDEAVVPRELNLNDADHRVASLIRGALNSFGMLR
jgi:hypothetical protein